MCICVAQGAARLLEAALRGASQLAAGATCCSCRQGARREGRLACRRAGGGLPASCAGRSALLVGLANGAQFHLRKEFGGQPI